MEHESISGTVTMMIMYDESQPAEVQQVLHGDHLIHFFHNCWTCLTQSRDILLG